MGWGKKLGEGVYNLAYLSDDGKLVLKIPKKASGCDSPERAVRVWNELNPHIKPAAYVTEDGKAWVCPFIEGEQASEEDIAKALIDIYNFSGRVVMDAFSFGNFLKTPTGQVVCVDIGMALLLDYPARSRRNSIASLVNWQRLEKAYKKDWDKHEKSFPRIILMTKALMFIKFHRSHIPDVSFLSTNQPLVELLANAFSHESYFIKALEALDRATCPPVAPKPVDLGKKGLGIPGGLLPAIGGAGRFFPYITKDVPAKKLGEGLVIMDAAIPVKPCPMDVFFKEPPPMLESARPTGERRP